VGGCHGRLSSLSVAGRPFLCWWLIVVADINCSSWCCCSRPLPVRFWCSGRKWAERKMPSDVRVAAAWACRVVEDAELARRKTEVRT
jgi:hypothetical protein